MGRILCTSLGIKSLVVFLLLIPSTSWLRGQDSAFIDSLEIEVTKSSDPVEKADLLNSISDYLLNYDVSLAKSYALKAYQIAEEASSKAGMVYSSFQLAKVYYIMSELDSAMDYAEKAEILSGEIGMSDLQARSMDAIGMIYYDIGNHAKSSEYFFASLKIYESLNDKSGLGGAYCRIGALFLDQKDYDKAAEYFKTSIQYAREIDHTSGIASNLNYLARVYYNKGDYEKAIQTYSEALKINKESGEAYLEAGNYLNIADVYIKLNEYNTAIDYLEKAGEIYQKLGNNVRLAKSLAQLSDVYYKTGQTDLSEKLAKEALAIGESANFKEIIVASSRVLYQLYIDKKDSATALKYFVLEKQYADSLFLVEKQKNLAALELQHQFDKKEEQQKIAKQRRIVIIAVVSGGIFFSLIILVLLVRYFRLKAKKLQLEKAGFEKELEFKNKELVLNVMSLMQKNEMLADLSQKLISIDESATTPESKDTIKKVAKELQKSQDKEIWKEFSTRFKEVHGDFYERLLRKYPDLTPNELKLCAFLRLNMSSKDIAELTGQRVSSLETARYRLRQKLGIANSDINLVTFLSSI